MNDLVLIAMERLEKAIQQNTEAIEANIEKQDYVIQCLQAKSQELADLRMLLAKDKNR